jgi:hypothetical protein
MMIALRDFRRIKRLLLVALVAVLVGVTPKGSFADGIEEFTGYTRPGDPPDVVRDGKIVPLAPEDPEAKKAVGATIYFEVFELTEDMPTDPFGTKYKDFDKLFKPGIDSANRKSPSFDRTARFLYLYQVVNDRRIPHKIHNVTVHLLVDESHITSWGYFADEKGGKALTGVSFAIPQDEKGKSVIRPVGADYPGVGTTTAQQRFTTPAPAYPFRKSPPSLLSGILIGNKPAGPPDPILDTTPGRVPEAVILMRSSSVRRERTADDRQRELAARSAAVPPVLAGPWIPPPGFHSPFPMTWTSPYVGPAPLLAAYSVYNPAYAIPELGPAGQYRPFGGAAVVGDPYAERYVAVRCHFGEGESDGPLEVGQRSTVWGYTSNDPPTWSTTKTKGSQSDIKLTSITPGSRRTPVALREGRDDEYFVSVRPEDETGAPTRTRRGPSFGPLSATPSSDDEGSRDEMWDIQASGGTGGTGGTGGASGTVPVPNGGPGLAGAPGPVTFPPLGGGGTTGGGGGGAGPGVGFPGIGAIGTATPYSGGGGGGTPSSGNGQGNQQQQQTPNGNQQQQAQQQQQQQPNTTPNNQTVTVTVDHAQAQAQAQRQRQNQRQSQHQNQHQNNHHGHGHMHAVPEPAAVVTALLGLPAFLIFRRRKKPE